MWAGETKAATLGQTKRDIKGGGRTGRDIRGGVEISRLYPIKAGFSSERGSSLMDSFYERQRTVCGGGSQSMPFFQETQRKLRKLGNQRQDFYHR